MSYASSEGSSLLPPVVFPSSISVDTISPISPSTVVEFTGSGGIDANQFIGASVISTTPTGIVQCGSAVANTDISSPTVYVNSIEPGTGQAFTQIISGDVATAIYGTAGNISVIGVNSQQSPFPAGGTQLAFQTYTNTTTAVSALTLTTTNCYIALPIVPQYTYPVSNTSSIGYTASSVSGGSFNAASANTLYNIATITIPITGLWMITAQCQFTTNSSISINTVANTTNNYCAVTSTIGSTQCSNVFNLTTGSTVYFVASAGSISAISNIYFVYTRIA